MKTPNKTTDAIKALESSDLFAELCPTHSAIVKAMNWRNNHSPHVARLESSATHCFPPCREGLNRPELWKPGNWKWLREFFPANAQGEAPRPGLPSTVLFGIRCSLEKLSRQADDKWKDCQFASKRIYEYGPLTTDIARDAGVSASTARYHLTRLWKAGEALKHLSYRGCIARWYFPSSKSAATDSKMKDHERETGKGNAGFRAGSSKSDAL